MRRLDFSKILFYTVSITVALGLSFALGLYTAANKTVVYRAVCAQMDAVKKSLNLVSEEAPTLAKTHPEHYLQPARYDGAGVTVNDVPGGEDEFIFLSGFFKETNELRLIRRDGTVVARWPVKFSEIFPDPGNLREPPETDWNVDIHGALALPDGSVVFNFEYGGLVKLDRCGNLIWKLARNTHHSVERAEGGGFWVPGRRYHSKESRSPYPPFETPFYADTIMKVSEDGNVISEISVPKLFYDNGLEALLTATGHKFRYKKTQWDHEILHLNKIEELSSVMAKDFPMFDAGDLAISLRTFNLIMIIDPHTEKIKWWQTGPWLRQHDPELIENGKMIVFNNNMYESSKKKASKNKSSGSLQYVSNIMELDFKSGETRVIYGGRKGQVFLTSIRGKQEKTLTGGLLVTEFEGGRVFETNTSGRVIWEYINRYDSDEVAEISEARVYGPGYFHVSDWSCE